MEMKLRVEKRNSVPNTRREMIFTLLLTMAWLQLKPTDRAIPQPCKSSKHTSALQAVLSYLSPASHPIIPQPCKLSHMKLKYTKMVFQFSETWLSTLWLFLSKLYSCFQKLLTTFFYDRTLTSTYFW